MIYNAFQWQKDGRGVNILDSSLSLFLSYQHQTNFDVQTDPTYIACIQICYTIYTFWPRTI